MHQPQDSIRLDPREFADPRTKRRIVQLTTGRDFFYPLYYFIPTLTGDGRCLVMHRRFDRQIQMYRLDLQTHQAVALTHATGENALWRPWLEPPAVGVRDQLSALNVATGELIYFDGQHIRGVHVQTFEDRLIHTLPADRYACGLTGVSPDGRHFVFPHASRRWWDDAVSQGKAPQRESAQDVCVDVIDLATGQRRTLVQLNSWITHTHFLDNQRVLFCHPPTEAGILLTDLRGGWYAHVRTADEHGRTSHYHATDIGIVYEMNSRVGVCDPATFGRIEYPIADYPVTHIGRDPQAKRWFFDTREPDPVTGRHTGLRCVCYLPSLRRDVANKPLLIVSGQPTYGENQVSHLHPILMPDRQSLLMTFGDPATQSTHIFQVDIHDLPETQREG